MSRVETLLQLHPFPLWTCFWIHLPADLRVLFLRIVCVQSLSLKRFLIGAGLCSLIIKCGFYIDLRSFEVLGIWIQTHSLPNYYYYYNYYIKPFFSIHDDRLTLTLPSLLLQWHCHIIWMVRGNWSLELIAWVRSDDKKKETSRCWDVYFLLCILSKSS